MDLYCEKWPKMTIFMRAERRKEWCHFHQTLSVISYDQNKYHGNDNFLSFEMPFIHSTKRPFWKITISWLFCPFASEVLPWLFPRFLFCLMFPFNIFWACCTYNSDIQMKTTFSPFLCLIFSMRIFAYSFSGNYSTIDSIWWCYQNQIGIKKSRPIGPVCLLSWF